MRAIRFLLCLVAAAGGMPHATAQSVFRNGFEPDGVPEGMPLNDTGVVLCIAAGAGPLGPCDQTDPPGQDALRGRDARAAAGQLVKVGSGSAGFDFSKISNSGQTLPAGAVLGTGANDWACTRDNRSGLIWEVKRVDPTGLRHHLHRYTWFEPTSPDGNPGNAGVSFSCADTLGVQPCNTSTFRAAVNAAGLCGASDWRLPTIKELESLASFGRVNPAIDVDFFPNTYTPNPNFTGAFYLTSTITVQEPTRVWVVFQETGEALPGSSRASANSIRLVRGATTPSTGYVDHGNGTVRHVPTGLIWKRCAEGQTWNGSTCTGVSFGYSWIDALDLAEASTFDGRTDWRLPNMKELRALVDETRTTPPIDPMAFPAAPVFGFWTSTARLDLPGDGWFIFFQGTGGPGWVGLGGEVRVRLVRGGE